jgi:glycosyltransferase involved in cell wall biosynthesis
MVIPGICIDCSPLLVRSAGVKTWLYHWLRALRERHPDGIQTLFEPRTGLLDHAGGLRLHGARLAMLQTINLLPAAAIDFLTRGSEVFHSSNLLRTVPKRPRLSTTLHDLTAWVVPEFHRPRQVTGDLAFAERILKRADGVIAVSESTRRDAVRLLGMNPERIRVIYPGTGPAYFSVTREQQIGAAKAYDLALPYFLFVGTIEPRKNIDTLLTAWTQLPPSFRSENNLVIVGMPGWKSAETLRRLTQLLREPSGVRYLGYVPESLVPGLTAGSQALIYPSFYEGFGIPVAQAMAAGCPVIASNLSSLPEITNGAALMIDPHSPGEIANAIRRVRESPGLVDQLRSAGRERAGLFTWDRAARESLEYFATLISS